MSIEEDIVGELLAARDQAQLAARPSSRIERFDLGQGYAVARRLEQRLVAERGWQRVGRKIGFTNRATWTEFSLDTPIWAPTYRETVHESDDAGGAVLSIASMTAPRIEPEVVVRLADELPAGPLHAEDIAAHLEWIAIGFEIVDCHYADWRFSAADAVADFGVHAALVVGPRWRLPSARDAGRIAELLPALRVGLHRDGALVAEGEGRNALGSPLLALAQLARTPGAAPLRAGETITTGTLTPLPYIHAGERWRVEVQGAPLPALELTLKG